MFQKLQKKALYNLSTYSKQSGPYAISIFHSDTIAAIKEIHRHDPKLEKKTKNTLEFIELVNKIFFGKYVVPSAGTGYITPYFCHDNTQRRRNNNKVYCMKHPMWKE